MAMDRTEWLRRRALKPSHGIWLLRHGFRSRKQGAIASNNDQYRCPPKDFKALRLERRFLWSQLRMGEKNAVAN